MNEAVAKDESNMQHIGGVDIPPTDPNEPAFSGQYDASNENDPLAQDDELQDPLSADDEGETTVTPCHEDRQLAQLIVDTVEQMQGLDNEVGQINAKKRELIEALEAHGIKRKAFRMAYAYYKADTDQRTGLDLSYAIVRSALGQSINPDDFALKQQ